MNHIDQSIKSAQDTSPEASLIRFLDFVESTNALELQRLELMISQRKAGSQLNDCRTGGDFVIRSGKAA